MSVSVCLSVGVHVSVSVCALPPPHPAFLRSFFTDTHCTLLLELLPPPYNSTGGIGCTQRDCHQPNHSGRFLGRARSAKWHHHSLSGLLPCTCLLALTHVHSPQTHIHRPPWLLSVSFGDLLLWLRCGCALLVQLGPDLLCSPVSTFPPRCWASCLRVRMRCSCQPQPTLAQRKLPGCRSPPAKLVGFLDCFSLFVLLSNRLSSLLQSQSLAAPNASLQHTPSLTHFLPSPTRAETWLQPPSPF